MPGHVTVRQGVRWVLVCCLLVCARVGAAQSRDVVIQGRVLDAETGAPVPRAHVFISHSTAGTTTDSTGRFQLTNLQRGAARLYVSHIQYEPQRHELVLPSDTTLEGTFRLESAPIERDTLLVTAERDEEWYERLERFRRLFVGPSVWADRCEFLNPEVLRFDTAWWGKFEAEATHPLVLVNRALGYQVTYYLNEFEAGGNRVRWDGEPLFSPLVPSDSAEAKRWTKNRRQAFRGSLRHFLLALLHGRLEEEQFRMYRQPRSHAFHRSHQPDRIPTSRERVLTLRPEGTHELTVRGRLEVHYTADSESETYLDWGNVRRAPREYQRSVIELNQRPVHIDDYGEIVEPYGATLHNYFAFTRRLATLLPKDYRPPSDSTLPPLTVDTSR